MRLFIAVPAGLTQVAHLEKALLKADLKPDELLLVEDSPGAADQWLRNWAAREKVAIRPCKSQKEALKLLKHSGESALLAVLSPDHPETLDLVSEAESMRVPVFIYRELYRQDPRVNCRFSPVERPDVWLRALTAEQRDFFRRFHALCAQYGVTLKTSQSDGGSLLGFQDGTEFEGVELNPEGCRVRPRGSFRYRRIKLD